MRQAAGIRDHRGGLLQALAIGIVFFEVALLTGDWVNWILPLFVTAPLAAWRAKTEGEVFAQWYSAHRQVERPNRSTAHRSRGWLERMDARNQAMIEYESALDPDTDPHLSPTEKSFFTSYWLAWTVGGLLALVLAILQAVGA